METTRHRAVRSATSLNANKFRRRAVAYIYFLSSTLLVSVIGLSALMFSRIQRRSTQGSNQSIVARFYAQSALELGFAQINLDSDWRTTLSTGTWFSAMPIGQGSYSLDVSIVKNGDGNTNNDPVLLIGTGICGQSTHKIEVTLVPLSDNGGLVISGAGWKRNTG